MRNSFVEMTQHLAVQQAEQDPAGIAAPEVGWAGVHHREITLYSGLVVSQVDTFLIFVLLMQEKYIFKSAEATKVGQKP